MKKILCDMMQPFYVMHVIQLLYVIFCSYFILYNAVLTFILCSFTIGKILQAKKREESGICQKTKILVLWEIITWIQMDT